LTKIVRYTALMDPPGLILGVRTPATPAAFTPMQHLLVYRHLKELLLFVFTKVHDTVNKVVLRPYVRCLVQLV